MKRITLLPLVITWCLWFKDLKAQFGSTPQILTSSEMANVVTDVVKFTTYDINGDGLTDLQAVSPLRITYYKSDGFGSFHAPETLMKVDLSELPTGSYGLQYFDIDNDGLPDVAAGKDWRKNYGNDSFGIQLPVFENSIVAFCDIDNDNTLDALSTDTSGIYWQKSLGNGSFNSVNLLVTADNPNILKTVDLDGDGSTDILFRQNDGCYWLKSDGNGSFQTIKLTSKFPDNLAIADLDKDGNKELIYSVGNTIEWYEFDSTGQGSLLQIISTKFVPARGFSVGDMNADGFDDVLIGGLTTGHSGSYYQYDHINGQFAASTTVTTPGKFPHFGITEIGDFDGDGKNDFCTVSANAIKMVWFRQISPGVFSAIQYLNAGLTIPKTLFSVDYDADGDQDLVSTGQEPANTAINTATVLVNLGNGQYDEKRFYPGGGVQSFSGDLDGDGLKDRAYPSVNDSVYWQKFLGNNLWGAVSSLPGLLTSCKIVAGGDLDNDGDIDLFACNGTDAVSVNARFYWFENDGKGHFTPHLVETDIQLCSHAFSADVNEDGWLDMVLYFYNKSPRVYKNQGYGQFTTFDLFLSPTYPSPTDVNQSLHTDLDADGRIDFVYVTKMWGDQKIAWYRNLGGSGFSEEKILASWSTNASWATNYFTVFDANGDGLPDIVISDNYWARIRFIKGLGNGTFSNMTTIYSETKPFNYGNFFAVTSHDVNGDGKPDIVFGKRSLNDSPPNYIMWLANESPAPVPQIQIINYTVNCDDNHTAEDGSDDILVLQMKVNNPADPSGKFFITDYFNTSRSDTFRYNTPVTYRWHAGSAGDGIDRLKFLVDLKDTSIFYSLTIPSMGSCSYDAPATISIFNYSWNCFDNGTPTDANDDFISVFFKAEPQNVKQVSDGYFLSCNTGSITFYNATENNLKYGVLYFLALPPGSATQNNEVSFTLKDKKDNDLIRIWSFDNPGPCSLSETTYTQKNEGLSVYPNPLAQDHLLHIELGENFSGSIKMDIISTDGSVLETWYENKSTEKLTLSRELKVVQGPFFIRVSDKNNTEMRLMLRF